MIKIGTKRRKTTTGMEMEIETKRVETGRKMENGIMEIGIKTEIGINKMRKQMTGIKKAGKI